MPKHEGVSRSVIKRLPRYYRFIGDLLAKGATRISSRELAQLMRLTASQIRQDLNCFGGFGQQGYGYNVAALHQEIGNILGLNEQSPILLIGAGNLGRTVARHMNFDTSGFRLIAIFDNNPAVIGQRLGDLIVLPIDELEDFCKLHHPHAATLCIPKECASEMVSRLVKNEIHCFWNFSHYDISLTHQDVISENVHLGDSLMTLRYQINVAYPPEPTE